MSRVGDLERVRVFFWLSCGGKFVRLRGMHYFPRNTLRERIKLLWGTPRRFYYNVFRPGFVRARLARRQGACKRCGACCQLCTRCRYLHFDEGKPACRLYHVYRPGNCSNFPITAADLADRDLVAPNQPCGYWWPTENPSAEKT